VPGFGHIRGSFLKKTSMPAEKILFGPVGITTEPQPWLTCSRVNEGWFRAEQAPDTLPKRVG